MDQNIHQKIAVNYERLRRQYEINIATFDKPALLDLSHILRIWVEMRDDVQVFLDSKENVPSFTNYHLTGKIKKFLWGKDYILTCFPGNVTTFAGKNEMFSSNDSLEKKKFTIMTHLKREVNNGLTFKNFLIVFTVASQDEGKLFSNMTGRKVPYSSWMQSEIVKLSFNDQNLPLISISREVLIKRVANILGGSHPEGNEETTNKFDPYINKLMQYNISGLPSPYLMLLKTAKDILEKIEI